jgi:hypothetical protein
MLVKSWAILGFDGPTIYSMHNTGGMGCNYKFSNLFLGVVYDQIWASFNTPTPQLQPLLIMGLGYQWSLDFASPLNLTP